MFQWLLNFMYVRTFGRLYNWLMGWWVACAELPDYDVGFALPASGRRGKAYLPTGPTGDPRKIPVDKSAFGSYRRG